MMLAMSTMNAFLSIALVIIALLLVGLILLQKNRGAGLSGAFGGVGGHTAFGTKTGDFLTWVTVGLVAVFLLLSIAGNYAFEPDEISTVRTNEESEGAASTEGGDTPLSAAPVSATPVSATPVPSPSATPITPVPVTPPAKADPSATPITPAQEKSTAAEPAGEGE